MAAIIVGKGVTDLTTLGIADHDTIQFSEGGQTITDSAQATLSGLTDGLAGIFFDPFYTGTIPDSMALKCDVDYGSDPIVVYKASGGSVSLWPAGGSGVITKVNHFGAGNINIVSGGTVTNWEQASGLGYLSPSSAITNFVMTGGRFNAPYAATAFTTGKITGGTLTSGRGWSTSLDQSGGTVTTAREDTNATLPTGATLTLTGDAKHYWRGGNITTLKVSGPEVLFDARDVTKAITITNLYCTGDAEEMCRKYLKGRNFAITVTNFFPLACQNRSFP